MAIYFKSIPTKEPFIFDSVGNQWEQDRVIRPEGYPGYHYIQTETGIGRIEIQGKEYILEKGEGVLIAPFIPHLYDKIAEKWTTCFITITGSMESHIGSLFQNKQVIFVEKDRGERIAAIIGEIIARYESTPTASKALSVECYRLLLEFADGVHTEEYMDDPLYVKYVAPVIREIEHSYGSDLTVQNLSKRVYITPQYLSKLFRRFLGCSTYEYLTNYRISKAKELLYTKRREDISCIGRQVGFEEASHFIEMFKKRTGMTPYQFRKK